MSCPVQQWSTQQVAHWLLGISMDHYAQEFMKAGIDGNQLLTLDSAKLKVGVPLRNEKIFALYLFDIYFISIDSFSP